MRAPRGWSTVLVWITIVTPSIAGGVFCGMIGYSIGYERGFADGHALHDSLTIEVAPERPDAAGSDDLRRRNLVVAAARDHGVDPVLALQVSLVENWGGDPRAVSHAGAVGIMQVMPFWVKHPYAERCIDRSGPPWAWPLRGDLTDPRFNACLGVRILRHYIDGVIPYALHRYNGAISPGKGEQYVALVDARYDEAERWLNGS